MKWVASLVILVGVAVVLTGYGMGPWDRSGALEPTG